MSLRSFVASVKLRRSCASIAGREFAFPSALRSPKQVLVCLPGGLRELTLVKQFLPAITELFKPAGITLLTMPGIRVADILPRKGFQLLAPTEDQLTWSGLPKASFLKAISDYKFDTVLDLNLEHSPFNSRVLLNFPNALRIGRGNHLGQPYYNLEIKTRYLRDERNIYRSLLETLAAIKGAGPKNALEETCT